MPANVATSTITWTGASGRKYKYWIQPIGSKMKDEPGNYMFIKKVAANRFKAIYVGETDSLDDRLSNPENHHKRPCTKRQAATHLCTHTTPGGKKARQAEEQDLIRALKPPCND